MSHRLHALLLATSALVPLSAQLALANPLGAQVVGGGATVAGQGTVSVTVTQSSPSAIINWQTFNIGAGETTRFVQPGANSVVLDRVTGGLGPSTLNGTLTSNGRVFLVNRDGVLVGPTGKIQTGGFLATTHDISNADFMAGKYRFSQPGRADASVVNQGSITAQSGGFAALVAPGVRNAGTITATLGKVALASGNGFSLDFYGDRLITLGVSDSIAGEVKDVSTGHSLKSLVSNSGTIRANGGAVQLTAVAARKVVDSVINNSGVVEAHSIGMRHGMIMLGAATGASKPAGAPTQVVKVSGKLMAVGRHKNTSGGTIVVTGESIKLAHARLDASGQAGGGKVLIGGDTGGGKSNPAVAGIAKAALETFAIPTASTVSIDAATTIDASAKSSGNGGKVVVWADGTTSIAGSVAVRGGAVSGDGGFVETSGHDKLALSGAVDVGAAKGASGTWLLDPTDVTIASTGAWVVTPAAIETALSSGNVVVTTPASGSQAGDITVAENVSWANGNSLTLSAARNITINGGVTISNTGSGDLNLRADNGATGIGTVSFQSSGKVDFSHSTGAVSIFYNPQSGYASPTNYAANVLTNGAPAQLTAYMLVNSVSDLQNINQNLSGTYALGKNIDASGYSGFEPIGETTNGFTGTFDGQGYRISNLIINYMFPYVGLFGYIGNYGFVTNVGLTNLSVIAPQGYDVGGLVGRNSGLITNSYTTGTVTGTSSTNVNYSGIAAGGLVGWNFGRVYNSYSTANVSTPSTFEVDIGGLAGGNFGIINQSHAAGSISVGSNLDSQYFPNVGGLVGDNGDYYFNSRGSIIQSYATGSVTAGIGAYVGGLVGMNLNGGSIDSSYETGAVTGGNGNAVYASQIGGLVGIGDSGFIQDSYSTGHVTGGMYGSFVGGLVDAGGNPGEVTNSYWDTQASGQPTSGQGTGRTTAQLKSGLPAGFDPMVWAISSSVNNGYPYLRWQTATVSPPSSTTLTGGPVGISPVSPSQTNPSAGATAGNSAIAGNGTGALAQAQSLLITSAVNLNRPLGSFFNDTSGGLQLHNPQTVALPLSSTTSNLSAAMIPLNEITIPALESIIDEKFSPFTTFLAKLPGDEATVFEKGLKQTLDNSLKDPNITTLSGGLAVANLALTTFVDNYIDDMVKKVTMTDNFVQLAADATAGYELKVLAGTFINYVTTPILWKTGRYGLAFAGSEAIVQTTIGSMTDATEYFVFGPR